MSEHILDKIDPKNLGRSLQEARRARGLTQKEAADHLEVARTTLIAIEKGERRIRPGEIIKLAQLYGRSLNELMGEPQTVDAFEPMFRAQTRSFGGAGRQELLDGQEVLKVLDDFERLCRDYLWLESLTHSPLMKRYPPVYDVRGGSPKQAGEEVAAMERNRLGLGDGPLSNLREMLEMDVGIRIFYYPLPSKVSGIYAYTEELGGCVMINSSHPTSRQHWSLAHDFAHFLTDRYKPSFRALAQHERKPAPERFADAFAMNFLMPTSSLRRAALGIVRSSGDFKTSDLCQLAHLYSVSVEAMCRRLEQIGSIPSGTWERLKLNRFKVREAQKVMGLHERCRDGSELPIRYQMLAVQAFDNEDLSEGQLARVLRCTRVEAREIAHTLWPSVEIDEDGDITNLEFDTSESLRSS